jgi:hypothetical protein
MSIGFKERRMLWLLEMFIGLALTSFCLLLVFFGLVSSYL